MPTRRWTALKLENLPRWLVATAAYLVFLWIVSVANGEPLRSIFPYAVPVVVVTARWGLWPGLSVSLAATLTAWSAGAFPTVPENAGLEFDEGVITLAELTVAALVVSVVTRRRARVREAKD